MSDVYIDQELEHLERCGFLTTAAGSKSDHFKALFCACKKKFSTVKFVANASYDGIGEIIYLPKGRREVMSILRNSLFEHERAVKKVRRAITHIQNDH